MIRTPLPAFETSFAEREGGAIEITTR